MITKKLPPISIERLIKCLRRNARVLDNPYEGRDPEFEEAAVAWAMREAAKRLNQQEAKIARLELRLAERDKR